MRSSTSSFDIGARTDRGRQRSNNQDTIGRADQWEDHGNTLDRELRERYGRLYIVADGVGGNADGADASRMVVDQVMQLFYHSLNQDGISVPLPEIPDQRLRASIEHVTGAIYAEAQRRGNNMASTIVAALIYTDQLTVANVGDSPAFLVRPNQSPKQLTKAHIRQEADGGKALAQAMGDPQVSVTMFSLSFQEGDSIILCSDGLTDLVQPAEIAEVVQTQSANDAARTLIDMANRRGGHDNISAIVIRNGPPHAHTAVPKHRQRVRLLLASLVVIGLLVAVLVLVPRLLVALPSSNGGSPAPSAIIQTVSIDAGNNQGYTVPGQPTATLSLLPTATETPTVAPTATHKPLPTPGLPIKPTVDLASATEITVTTILTSTDVITSPTITLPVTSPDLRPTVPPLVGKTQAEAEDILKQAGIASRVEEVTSSWYPVPIGVVADTDPAVGTPLEPRQVVTLKVKKHKPESPPADQEKPPPAKP